jgi:hypothetical protein
MLMSYALVRHSGPGKCHGTTMTSRTVTVWRGFIKVLTVATTTIPEIKKRKDSDESGIRTHAPEETRSLVWRLRPLGHLALKEYGGIYFLVGKDVLVVLI